MNVLFLDIDGVLNYYEYHKKHLFDDNLGVDLEKVKLLKVICDKYDLKVVLSSSWKLNIDEFGISEGLYNLCTLFYNMGIDLIDVTPNIPNPYRGSGQVMWKEWDIECYLYEHPEVEKFCIIDDETYDLKNYKDKLILTDYMKGLEEKNINDIGLVLKN